MDFKNALHKALGNKSDGTFPLNILAPKKEQQECYNKGSSEYVDMYAKCSVIKPFYAFWSSLESCTFDPSFLPLATKLWPVFQRL